MRLTLRTLLAYMDDCLEPEDREDMAVKVRESENANTLIHRIRDVTRRMRLGAPQVIGNGMGRDPNSVAEYLDSTLAVEQLQLFDKVCLESDVHLAEVGSCHHILTMILGQPAQFDPATRERMYRLVEEAAARRSEEVAAANAAATVAPLAPGNGAATLAGPAMAMAAPAATEQAAHRKPEVPDYLRPSNGPSWKAIALTVAGAALVTAIVLAVIFPERIGLRKPAGATETPIVQKGDKSSDEKASLPAEDKGNSKAPAALESPKVAPVAPAVEKAPVDKNQAEKSADTNEKSPPATAPVVAPATPGPAAVPPPTAAPTSPPKDAPTTADIVAVPKIVEPEGPMDKVPATPSPPVPAVDPKNTPPATPVPAPKEPDNKVASLEPKIGAVEPPPADAPPAAIGRLLSQGHVLLKARGKGDWERLPSTTPVLHVGDRLLALPAFRPMISVNGLSLQLDGSEQPRMQHGRTPAAESSTELTLGPTTDGTTKVTIAYGRIVIRSLGQSNSALRVNTGAGEGVLTFSDAEPTVGVLVRLVHPPGTDPEKVAPQREVELYIDKGKVDWTMDGKTTMLAGPRSVTLADGALIDMQPAAMPAWLAAAQVSPLDLRAAKRIEEGLTPDRPVKLSLAELLLQQRIEVRSLAARSSAYVGFFDPLVSGLSEEDQRAGWPTFMSELQAAVARDPQTAYAVRETFERIHKEKAPDLYRMLWGYTPAGLKKNDARHLVELLDHDDLIFRVMSFMNLLEITDKGLNYQPEKPRAARRTSFMRWQKRLEEGKVAFADTTAPAAPAPKVGAPVEPK